MDGITVALHRVRRDRQITEPSWKYDGGQALSRRANSRLAQYIADRYRRRDCSYAGRHRQNC